MSPRFVELTHGTSGLLLAFLSIQIPMLVGLIRGRARLAQLVLSPVPAVVLTLIMGILMGLLAPLLTALGAPPDSGPDFTVATALCVAAGYAAGRLLIRKQSASASYYRRGAVVENAAAASRAPPAARVARANGGSQRCDGALTLAGLTVGEDDETKHFKVIGTTGTGKSTAIREVLSTALKRGDRAVIADPDWSSGDRVPITWWWPPTVTSPSPPPPPTTMILACQNSQQQPNQMLNRCLQTFFEFTHWRRGLRLKTRLSDWQPV